MLLWRLEFFEAGSPDESELIKLLDQLLHNGRVLLDGPGDVIKRMLAVALLQGDHHLRRDHHGLFAQHERIPQGHRLLVLVIVDRQRLYSPEMRLVDVFWAVGHGGGFGLG